MLGLGFFFAITLFTATMGFTIDNVLQISKQGKQLEGQLGFYLLNLDQGGVMPRDRIICIFQNNEFRSHGCGSNPEALQLTKDTRYKLDTLLDEIKKMAPTQTIVEAESWFALQRIRGQLKSTLQYAGINMLPIMREVINSTVDKTAQEIGKIEKKLQLLQNEPLPHLQQLQNLRRELQVLRQQPMNPYLAGVQAMLRIPNVNFLDENFVDREEHGCSKGNGCWLWLSDRLTQIITPNIKELSSLFWDEFETCARCLVPSPLSTSLF
jgi:hypothetical protein